MSFAGNLLLRATGQRAVKRFDKLSHAPAQSQQRLLREILGTNADTEFDERIADPDGSALVDQVDAAMGDQNSEYQTRRKSLRYGAPVIRVVPSPRRGSAP